MSQDNRRSILYSQHKPHPLNALLKDNNSTYRSTLETTNRTDAQRKDQELSSKRNRGSYREYAQRLDRSLNNSPMRTNFRISDTFVKFASKGKYAETPQSILSEIMDFTGQLKPKSRKVPKPIGLNYLYEPFVPSQRAASPKKIAPPELSLKSLIFSGEQDRVEESAKIYGPSFTSSLLPNRIVARHIRSVSPSQANQRRDFIVRKSENTVNNAAQSNSVSQKSDWNTSKKLFPSKPKFDPSVAVYKNALEKRLQTIKVKQNRKDFIDFVNEKEGIVEAKARDSPSKLPMDESTDKSTALDELDKVLETYDRRSFVKKGNLLYPTMGTKMYKIQSLNDDYLRPLLEQTRAKIESTQIII